MPKTNAIQFEDASNNTEVTSKAMREEIINEVLAGASDSKLLSALTTGLRDALNVQGMRMILILDSLLYRVAEWVLCEMGETPTVEKFTQATLVASAIDSFIEVRVDGIAPSGGRKAFAKRWVDMIGEWVEQINDLRLIIRNLKAAGIIVEIPPIPQRYENAKKYASERKENAKLLNERRNANLQTEALKVIDEDGI